jgi:predicted outer membrane repeat protein
MIRKLLLCIIILMSINEAKAILYVTTTGAGNETGFNWQNAMTLQSALFYVGNMYGDSVHNNVLVAQGVYALESNYSYLMQVKTGINILGGFQVGATMLTQRNPTLYKSILRGNNATTIHLVNLSNTVVIDGFTIENGSNNFGGGIYAKRCNAIFKNCIIQKNYATYSGGGVYVDSNSAMVFNNCYFNNNKSGQIGGGLSAFLSSPTFKHCSFSNDSASLGGGAIFLSQSNPKIDTCTFNQNKVYGNGCYGGAIFSDTASNPVFTKCVFESNSAITSGSNFAHGGALFTQKNGALLFSRCQFNNNETSRNGGAIFALRNIVLSIDTCTFTNNIGYSGGAVLAEESSNAYYDSCVFTGNKATYAGGAIGHLNNARCEVTKSIFTNNKSNTIGGAIFQNDHTLKVTNSLFTKDTASFGGAIAAYKIYLVGNGVNFVSKYNIYDNNIALNGSGGALMIKNSENGYDSLLNNVFAENKALGTGSTSGAVYHESTAIRAYIANNTFYNNITNGIAGAVNFANDNVIRFLYNNVFYKSTNNLDIIGSVNIAQETNNTYSTTNPYFVNENNLKGSDNIWGTADDGLQIMNCGIGINSGNNSKVPANINKDILGNNRILNTTVDIGAYERVTISADNSAALPNVYNTVTANQISNATTLYTNGCAGLISTIQSNGSSPINGNTTSKVWIETIQNPQFVNRHYEITPINNANNATGKITLYFTQADFNDFNAVNAIKLPIHPTDASGKTNLKIEKRSGTSSNGTGMPESYIGSIATLDPDDNDIVWDANFNRWAVSFNVTGFSGFFIKTIATPLAVHLSSFEATADNNCVNKITWTTHNDKEAINYNLQYSNDGKVFKAINSIAARQLDGLQQYQILQESNDIEHYYRLEIYNRDGAITYSPTAYLNHNCLHNQVTLYPNPTKDAITIKGMQTRNTIIVSDLVGKTISTHTTNSNTATINLEKFSAGIFIITVLNDNNQILLIQKVVKH